MNVFELGHTYLQLVRTLNLRLPPIDPSHHISRFAALLEFGDETPRVAVDATRLVARMDRDWLARGRRPSGICGAALLLAARMNNFRRSVAEIVQVVKIADSTVRKRLDEFRRTGSAALSVGDFRSVWLEEEAEPPAFVRGREKEEREREEREGGGVHEEEVSTGRAKGKGKKRKRRRGEESEEEEGGEIEGFTQQSDQATLVGTQGEAHVPLDPTLFNQGILVGTTTQPLFLPDDPHDYDPALLAGPSSAAAFASHEASGSQLPPPSEPHLPGSEATLRPPSPVEASLDLALTEEVSAFLDSAKGAQLSSALDDADAQKQVSAVEELQGLDEDELDAFLLSGEEVKLKERIWVEMNRDYLENLAGEYLRSTSVRPDACVAEWADACAFAAKAELEQLEGENTEKKKRKVRLPAGVFLFCHYRYLPHPV